MMLIHRLGVAYLASAGELVCIVILRCVMIVVFSCVSLYKCTSQLLLGVHTEPIQEDVHRFTEFLTTLCSMLDRNRVGGWEL